MTRPPDDPILENISFQYRARGSVTVACALPPLSVSDLAAFSAMVLLSNRPYTVDPEPESEAYFASAFSRARLTSRMAGCLGKTTLSKPFSIPVQTRARSIASAPSQPLLGAPRRD